MTTHDNEHGGFNHRRCLLVRALFVLNFGQPCHGTCPQAVAREHVCACIIRCTSMYFRHRTASSPLQLFVRDSCLFTRLLHRSSRPTMGFLGTLAALAAIGSIPATAFQTRRLDVIDLPIGYFPEGIALAEEWTVFVGSFIGGPFRTILATYYLSVSIARPT